MNTKKINNIKNKLNQIKTQINELENTIFYFNFNKMDYVNKCLLNAENIEYIKKHGIKRLNNKLKKYFQRNMQKTKKSVKN